MTPELTYLAYSVVLLIAHVLVQATFSDLSKGIGWALGPRDEYREQNPLAERLQKALRNYLETYVAFVALALAVTVADAGNETTALGAAVWFWARVVYVPVYVSGVPLIRSVVFFVSLAGLGLILIQLL
jgi:uncharacterized MAPEG superfamily protein